jgi:ElaA protein
MFGRMNRAPPLDRSNPLIAPRWQWSRLPGLAAADLYAVLAARQQVFAVEQHCAYQDADGHDFAAWHLLGWTVDSAIPKLAAYLRVLDPGTKFEEPSIGRVLTVPPWRRTGLGRVLMREGVERCRAAWPGRDIRIAAQARLEAFYKSLDFRSASAPYIEDGIPHVDMVREAG